MSARSSSAGSASKAIGVAAEALGERDRPLAPPVGDEHRRDALLGQRPRGQLGGLARADDQHVAARERRRARRARRRPRPRRRSPPPAPIAVSRPHALAGRQRGAEQLVGQRPGRARGERELVGALDLALDLGLADDHRLQAARHAVEVARGVAVRVRVDALEQLGRAQAGAPGEHPEHGRLRLHRVARRRRRARCGCRSRARPPRGSPGGRRARAGTARRACRSARSRSRSASGAVLCDVPSSSSSLTPAAPPARSPARARAARRARPAR